MPAQHTLASLLDAHMQSASVGDARLANLVNDISGNPYFIHRSTIRNWRVGSAKKANNWRQLVTIAVALRLDENEANTLLESGGCPPIQALAITAKEVDQALLGYWKSSSQKSTEDVQDTDDTIVAGDASEFEIGIDAQETIETKETRLLKNEKTTAQSPIIVADSSVLPPKYVTRSSGRRKINLALGILATGCLLLSFGLFQFLFANKIVSPKNILTNSYFKQGAVGWIAYSHEAAAATFNIDQEAMHITVGERASKAWHIMLSQKNLEVTAGKIYTARFRVRGDAGTSIEVNIVRDAKPQTTLTFHKDGVQRIFTTPAWTQHSIEFQVVETMTLEDGGARLVFRFGQSEKGSVLMDDVEFFEGRM